MAEIKMGVVESHFADIIWANEPLHSRDLVKLCEKELNWNRSTTYTVLRKLCERGIFQNNGGTVSSVLTKNEFYAVQSEQFVDETFEGSLPAFIAAFTQRKCYHKFTGKAAVLGLFVFLHRIPQNASVTPRSRSDWRKKYFLPDKPSFSGVIMLNPIVVVVYL